MSDNIPSQQSKFVIAFDAKRLFYNNTGLGNYARTLVRNLQYYFPEHEYHLFTPGIKKNEETQYFLDPEKFTIHTPGNKWPLWRSFGIASQINDLRPDIYHGLSHELPFGLNPSIKKVVTFHDLIYEKYPNQFGWWDRKMYHFKYKNAAIRADYILAISHSTKLDLKEIYQIAEDKIHVLYQSCHQRFQEGVISHDALPTSIQNLENYYLYVGSLIERKSLLQIVLAFSLLPDIYRKPFVVIGKGDKAYTKKIMDMISYYKLENYFYFIQNISNSSLVHVYDKCFCLVYPSIYEGFGIPVIESLFRHKPVITSDISSLPEAAGPGAILVNPFQPKDIAQAMSWLHDDVTYHTLTDKGNSFVLSHFSSQVTSDYLMQFYTSALD